MGASESHGTCDRRDAEPHGSDGECFATSTSTPESQGELNTTSLPVEDESSILEEWFEDSTSHVGTSTRSH